MRDRTVRAFFILHPSSFILIFSHAAIFAGCTSLTDAVIVPLGVVPNVTTNVPHGPAAVERMPWIWYVTVETGVGSVLSTNSFTPTPPRNEYSVASPTLRKT